jgi:hypothetical protein
VADLDDRLEEAGAARDEEPEKDQVEVLEGQQRDEDHTEAELEDDAVEIAAARYGEVTDQVAAALHGQRPDLGEDRGLSSDEKAALRLLTSAASGQDLIDEQPLLAEDRLAMLNHALALLQPTLALGLTPELAGMRDRYDQLVTDVTELREHLEQLDGAQEEQAAEERAEAEAEGADEDDPEEKPADKGKAKENLWAKRNKGKKPPAPPKRTGEPERDTLVGKPGEPAVERPVVEPTVFGKPGEPAVPDRPVRPSTAWDGPDSGEKR